MDGSRMIGEMHTRQAALARRITVAVPAFNEARVLRTTLRALMTGDPALALVDLAVADGASTDDTRAVLEELQATYPNLRIVDNPGRWQAAGVNAVARSAGRGRDILLRCDARCLYPPDFVLRVAQAMTVRGVASLAVPMDAVGKGCFQKANAWIVDTPFGSGGSAHRGGRRSAFVDHGHHAGFDLERFTGLGGYDETFSHNEDAEYDARLAKAGGRVWLDATIRIGYCPRATLRGLWRQYHDYGRGRAATLLKHGTRPRLRQLIPVLNILALIVSVLAIAFTPLGFLWPGIYLSILVLSSLWLLVVKRSLCGLYGGVALGAMHLAWGSGFLRRLLAGPGARKTGGGTA